MRERGSEREREGGREGRREREREREKERYVQREPLSFCIQEVQFYIYIILYTQCLTHPH